MEAVYVYLVEEWILAGGVKGYFETEPLMEEGNQVGVGETLALKG